MLCPLNQSEAGRAPWEEGWKEKEHVGTAEPTTHRTLQTEDVGLALTSVQYTVSNQHHEGGLGMV